jgi:thiol-disulfide isomerase/thioredoxin
MKHLVQRVALLFIFASAFRIAGCGQTEIEIPDSASWNGACGDWYPGGDDTTFKYAFEQDEILPCAVFESARLGGEDTYINVGDFYLDAKHGLSDRTSLVFVVSAENCPSCAVLMQDLIDSADEIDDEGAVMIDVTFCDNLNRTDCDFDLDRAEAVALAEGWQGDRWLITNDEEGHIRPLYQDSFPTIITARLSDMKVVSVDRLPSADDLMMVLSDL